MKKISLKSIKTEELLSREELKQIMGGFAGSGGGNGTYNCVDCNGNTYTCTAPSIHDCFVGAAEHGTELCGCTGRD